MADGLDIRIHMGKVPILIDRLRGNTGAKAGVKAGAEYLQKKAADYPPQRRQRQKPKTDKQRRYLMWAIRTGVITIPYRRTGQLGRGWKVQLAQSGMAATVYNAQPAAKWVHHSKSQSAYHRNNWATDAELVKAHGSQVAHLVRLGVIGSLKP